MIKARVRQPRGAVKVNGQLLFWKSWEVNNNTYYQADTFAVTLPISGQPKGIDLDFWAKVVSLEVEIFAGFPSDPNQPSMSEMASLILGGVDDIGIDPTGTLIELSGRDYTSRLIDDQTTKKWQNMEVADIVKAIAKAANLKPVGSIPTGNKAGKFYNIDHAKLDTQKSKWDVLCSLAHQIGFQVYVKGTDLHFEPMNDDSDPYVVEWDKLTAVYPNFDGMSIKFNRNLTLARDVVVYVHSWNSKNIKGFTRKAMVERSKDPVLKRASRSAASIPVGQPQVYSYTVPNLTPEQALKLAQAKLKSITQHEMRVAMSLPGDNILMPPKPISITGTGAYDQLYYPDSVVRRMSMSGGYTMDVIGKNHNTDSYKVL